MFYFGRIRKTSTITLRRIVLFSSITLLSVGATIVVSYLYMPSRDVMVRQTVIPDAIPQVVIEVVGAPLRLVIASLGINAAIQPVGLTSEGDMAIGNDTTQVAWYQLGPKPGEKGSAVIAGHYGGKYRSDVVFYNLDSLKTGDTVSVHDDTNNVRNFRVRSIRSYGPDDDTATVFSSSDGKAHLNLITCAGTWDASTQMYSERIVVFTDQDTAQY